MRSSKKNSSAEWYYESTKDDSEVEAAIRQKAEVTNKGFWKIFRLIRKDGHPWNHKKVHRVYEAIHFNKRKPLRKRLPARSCRRSKSGALHTGISHEFQEWCEGNGIKILYTQPGRPTQNSYIERFNGSYRRAVLDAYIFRTLDDVREVTEKWMDYNNNESPHDALNNLAPMEYRLARTG